MTRRKLCTLRQRGAALVGELSGGRWLLVVDGAAYVLAKPAPAPARGAAVAFLRLALAEGPRLARELLTAAAAAGISRPALVRARRALGVSSRKTSVTGAWRWSLSTAEGGAPAAEPSKAIEGSATP